MRKPCIGDVVVMAWDGDVDITIAEIPVVQNYTHLGVWCIWDQYGSRHLIELDGANFVTVSQV